MSWALLGPGREVEGLRERNNEASGKEPERTEES